MAKKRNNNIEQRTLMSFITIPPINYDKTYTNMPNFVVDLFSHGKFVQRSLIGRTSHFKKKLPEGGASRMWQQA